MNGNFNLSQKKIIQLLLKMDMVPDLRIRTVEDYLATSKGAKADRVPRKPEVKASKTAAASKQRAVRVGTKRAAR